jgi:DNA mismatch repair protein MutL
MPQSAAVRQRFFSFRVACDPPAAILPLQMPRVHVMSDALASQVAAGEVVERPASVVKELVENSLDAGARELRVEFQRGGVALVKVTDDGCGMSREDALLSLERHATSKLRDKEGLERIQTLGFRGEALPSIASVARFRLITRERDAVEGTEIVVEGGRMRDARDAGCPPGTVVEVRELFFNVPARRKFLKSETTEAAHIDHQVRLHALAAPATRVILRKDGRGVIDVAATGDRRLRIGDLFGRDVLGKLLDVPLLERPGMSVSGHLLPAAEARTSRKGQYLFLNGRPVEDRVVFRALEEAFRGNLPAGRFPGAWLWLEMDPALVDVNVHPAKREVRFHRVGELRTLIVDAVEQALRTPRQAPVVVGRGAVLPARHESSPEVPAKEAPAVAGGAPDERPAPEESAVAPAARPFDVETARRWQAESQTEIDEHVPEAPKQSPAFRIIGTMCGEYVLLEAHDGLVLLDPRAARERILYERFLQGAEEGTAESQGLLVPELLELDARDADVVCRNVDNFAEAGMEVESFGGVTVQLRALPAMLAGADPKALLLDLVDALGDDGGRRGGKALAFEKFAVRLARVGSQGEPCRGEAARVLLEELFSCDLPYCTPDGKPTLVQLSLSELGRKFGKK